MTQQGGLTQLIDSLGTQLQRLESASVQNIAGQEFPMPQISNTMGRDVPNSPDPAMAANFQVKADLNIGKFSGVDPTPHDVLTFEQWVSNVYAFQTQFPDFIYLPAVCKSIQG